MAETVNDDQVFAPVAGLEINEVPDGRVIYQAAREKVHYLNPTALIVFELCADHMPVGEIARVLKDAYQLDAAPIGDVRSCVASLVSEGLVAPWTP